MATVYLDVQSCFVKFKVPGHFKVKVVVANGVVTSATVLGAFAGTPTGDCVVTAVMKATFAPGDSTFNYPFTFK
jgi:hypothetical protein